MELHTTKALVLRSLPFQESKTIVTLFSEKLGLLPALIKKTPSGKNPYPFIEPFCEAEFLLYEGSSEFLHCKEASLLSQNLFLRADLHYLQTAAAMLRAILHSQLPRKPSPDLYSMLIAFLRQVPSHSASSSFLAFFYMKMLKHEGVYNPLYPEESESFSLSERDHLHRWMHSQQFHQAVNLDCPAHLLQRIESLFYDKSKH